MGRYSHLYDFANLKGPGDSRPTALQIIADENRTDGSLNGKNAVVTGCTSGLGPETAKALHAAGMNVWCTGRGLERLQKGLKAVGLDPTTDSRLHLLDMDLGENASVRRAASQFLSESGGKLSVLINNAGVMKTPQGMKTKDGLDAQFGTNHVGHFLFFMLVKDALIAGSTPEFNSRVVNLSSSGHRFGTVRFDDYNFEKRPEEYGNGFPAYGQSKTANIWMANYIDRHFGSKGIHAWSAHPGWVWTELGRHDSTVVTSLAPDEMLNRMMRLPAQGSAPAIWCATARELEGKGGKYTEDCEIAGPIGPEPWELARKGYTPWAYDVEGEEKLWKLSLELTGLDKE